MLGFVGGRRGLRRRLAPLVGVVAAVAVVLVPTAGTAPDPIDVFQVSYTGKCDLQDPNQCPFIPGWGKAIGGAEADVKLYKNLVTGATWGYANVTHHIHTPAGGSDGTAGAVIQRAEYTSWYIKPSLFLRCAAPVRCTHPRESRLATG